MRAAYRNISINNNRTNLRVIYLNCSRGSFKSEGVKSAGSGGSGEYGGSFSISE